ncbi:DNA-directed RNA polymerases i, ii, and iii 145 kDa polypeptide [Acrodontium crateriforme]|uniref:DNA-directed RNA polymerases I, II, and III subunit RPABC3 n=1 Tax=Acrodontium crateriforme TaxID=150365 RepID=A0AAQ3MBF5_9PEZI|nr:DNA-directed RNA polymerases i, ii, and iii 145 kDa polypeptide [Acrodontium crateriforme]
MSDAQLYEAAFTVTQIVEGVYDRVTRLIATSNDSTTTLTLDINSELYPLSSGDQFNLLVATTLNLDGKVEEGKGSGWRERRSGEQTLADLWDYVCYGKVYRHEEMGEGGNIKVYVSFGGLLMCLDGPYRKLSPLRIDNVYLLLKR